jgi:uncharacterized protein (TIGR03067 family)
MRTFQRISIAIGLLATPLDFGMAVPAAEVASRRANAAAADAQELAGVWLSDSATIAGKSRLPELWNSKLTVTADSFSLSRYADVSKDLRGRFRLDPSTDPKTIDLQVDALDLSEAWVGVKIPACSVPGIYKLDGGRLTL